MLEHYASLTLICSYLYNMNERVNPNGENYNYETVSYSLLQLSVLGPFFIIYVDDMHSAAKSSSIHQLMILTLFLEIKIQIK